MEDYSKNVIQYNRWVSGETIARDTTDLVALPIHLIQHGFLCQETLYSRVQEILNAPIGRMVSVCKCLMLDFFNGINPHENTW